MKRIFVITLVILFSAVMVEAQKKLVADASATVIDWTGNKIVGNQHVGTIDLHSGWLAVEENAITGGEFIVDMRSIKNNDLKDEKSRERLVGHLKSDDFFGVEKYPLSRLVITGSSKSKDGKTVIRGTLTIKEATHPVEFAAIESRNGDVSTFTATIAFDRSLYDVRYGSGNFFANLGDNAINDEIRLNVKLVLK